MSEPIQNDLNDAINFVYLSLPFSRSCPMIERTHCAVLELFPANTLYESIDAPPHRFLVTIRGQTASVVTILLIVFGSVLFNGLVESSTVKPAHPNPQESEVGFARRGVIRRGVASVGHQDSQNPSPNFVELFSPIPAEGESVSDVQAEQEAEDAAQYGDPLLHFLGPLLLGILVGYVVTRLFSR